jgi:ADP-ribose pyrophosphatase
MAMENDARSPVRRVVIHKGRKFDYESLEYVSKSGRTLTKQVVRHPGAVVIVPILPGPGGEPHVALIRSFRASLEKYILELPAGTREVGEDAATTAGREIVEETGYEAATLTEIGRFYTSPGLSDELMVAYAATGLSHVGQRLEEDEDLTVQMTSVEETFALMETGELMDAKSMLALHLARRKGLL